MTPELIRGFHRALHMACGVPSLSPTGADDLRWRDFLCELAPLVEEDDGPLTTGDIQSVVGEMRRQNKNGDARWSLRPSKILAEPETFRDLVLLTRTRRRAARERARAATHVARDRATPEDNLPATELHARREEFQKLRQSLGLSRPE